MSTISYFAPMILGFLLISAGLGLFCWHLANDKIFRYYIRLGVLVLDTVVGIYFITFPSI